MGIVIWKEKNIDKRDTFGKTVDVGIILEHPIRHHNFLKNIYSKQIEVNKEKNLEKLRYKINVALYQEVDYSTDYIIPT